MMPPYPQWQTMDDGPPLSTAQVEKAPGQAIIGGENMDEEVHEFVNKHTTGLNQHKKHHKKHHRSHSHSLMQSKHKKKSMAKDMAERGMDEEVYDFTHE